MAEVTTDQLKERGIFLLFGRVDEGKAYDVVSWILEMNSDPGKLKNLTLVINSPGGSLTDGFAIIDAIAGSKLPVHTVGIGQISSAAFMIFIAGKKGQRLLTPNTSILSHQWAWGIAAKAHELLAVQKEYDLITKRLLSHYRKYTGLSEKIITQKLLPAEDVWLSAAEAKKLGICDVVKDFK